MPCPTQLGYGRAGEAGKGYTGEVRKRALVEGWLTWALTSSPSLRRRGCQLHIAQWALDDLKDRSLGRPLYHLKRGYERAEP